jgi:hypothetical protein
VDAIMKFSKLDRELAAHTYDHNQNVKIQDLTPSHIPSAAPRISGRARIAMDAGALSGKDGVAARPSVEGTHCAFAQLSKRATHHQDRGKGFQGKLMNVLNLLKMIHCGEKDWFRNPGTTRIIVRSCRRHFGTYADPAPPKCISQEVRWCHFT